MEPLDQRNLILRIIEFGIKNPAFTYNQMTSDLKLNSNETTFTRHTLFSEQAQNDSPNKIFRLVDPRADSKVYNEPCMILPNALFSYIDHLEIVEARKAAKDSKKLAWIAIWISTGIGLVSLLLGTWQIYLQLK